MPLKLIERAEEEREISVTAPGLRLEENFGTPYKTGQTASGLQLSIDILTAIEVHAAFITAKHNPARAQRFREWAKGRRWNSFWWAHRRALRVDREEFQAMLRRGGYYGTSGDSD